MTTFEQINELATLGGYWCELMDYPGVLVSAEGHVLSLRSGRARLLKGTRKGKYLALSAVRKGPYLHQLMCEVFHGSRPDGCEVRHLDGNRDNNAANNLAWGTRSQNRADMVGHGTSLHGARNPMAKLTPASVAEMRAIRFMSGASYRTLAERFGVATMTAFRAVRGQSWI